MTEYEAYQLAAQYVELSHTIGEATHDRLQFWVGVSFTLLGITYLAPERLTIPVTTGTLFLYLCFTVYVISSGQFDTSTGGKAAHDAQLIANQAGLDIGVVKEKLRGTVDTDLMRWHGLGLLFVPGLFLTVITYLPFVAFRQRRLNRQSQVSR